MIRFQDMAVGYSYSRLGDEHLAEDAAQDAFLAAFKSILQLRDDFAFPGWLRATVHRSCERIQRKRRSHLPIDASHPIAPNNPRTDLEIRQLHSNVRSAIEELPKEERIAITLAYMSNCSHRQIAEFLDISNTTVNNRLRSARQRLAARLRNPTRDFLRARAPSTNRRFQKAVRDMIQPIEFKQTQPQELPGGYSSTTTEIWQMLSACREGDLETVRHLVERCPGLIHCEFNYTPPIHFAVREGHEHLVRYLLEHGANTTYKSYFGDTLLQIAREREFDQIAAIIEESLSNQFPISDDVPDLLKAAGEGELNRVQQLLDSDSQLARASNELGETALHRACEGGHAEVARLLLDRGADSDAAKGDGFKPIHSALFHNRQGWVRGQWPAVRKRGQKPEDGLRAGRLVGLLLERGANYNIYLAAVFGDTTAVKDWLKEDPSLANFEDTHLRRPLSAAAWREDIEMVRLLLEHGADPNLPESDCPRGHALWIAAFRHNIELARLLLEHGADPEGTAESGGRALGHTRNHSELYQLLLDHGAKPHDSPRDQLHEAIFDNDLEKAEGLLREHSSLVHDPAMYWGEGILVWPAKNAHWKMMDLLFRFGARVPDVSKWGCSYYLNKFEVAKHLLEKGMNPNHMNWHRTTLLHDFAHKGDMEKARLLVEHGADINAIDEEYRSTPLGLAARAGQKEIIEFLLEKGADPTAADAPWATPLAWARKRGHEGVVAMLEEQEKK